MTILETSPATLVSRRMGGRFWLIHAILPLCILTGLAVLFETTDLDLRLTDPFYDASHKYHFPARNSFWAETLLHKTGRNVVIGLGALCVGGFFASYRVERLRGWRRELLYMGLCIALCPASVAIVKELINRHTPLDYDRYGGKVPYVRLFERPAAGHAPAHDFPASHASCGFALLGAYFVFYNRNLRWALAGLCAGLLIGGLFGFAQQARGAHFASHNVYSLGICWFVVLTLYVYGYRVKLS